MSTKIKKLSNIQFTVTDDVLLRKWSDVKSKRNKLLSMSDWTQLPDSNVPANIQRLWVKWREKVRSIKHSSVNDPDKALTLLRNLERQMPEQLPDATQPTIVDPEYVTPIQNNAAIDIEQFKQYINEIIKTAVLPKIISIDEITNIINQKSDNNLGLMMRTIDDKIKQQSVVSLSDNLDEAKAQLTTILNDAVHKRYPKLNEELFSEALDYLSGSYTGDLPLLQLFANSYEKTLTEMAQHMLQQKKRWIKDICDIEKYRLDYLNKIQNSVTIEEIRELQTLIE